jgi:hypothetical protein
VNQPIKITLGEIVSFLNEQNIAHCVIGGLDQQILNRASHFEVFGMNIYVATSEDLVLMKLMAGRAVDQSDVQSIVTAQSDHLDWDYLSRTAAQIEEALAIDMVDTVNRLQHD